jgi:hypothetical protein
MYGLSAASRLHANELSSPHELPMKVYLYFYLRRLLLFSFQLLQVDVHQEVKVVSDLVSSFVNAFHAIPIVKLFSTVTP